MINRGTIGSFGSIASGGFAGGCFVIIEYLLYILFPFLSCGFRNNNLVFVQCDDRLHLTGGLPFKLVHNTKNRVLCWAFSRPRHADQAHPQDGWLSPFSTGIGPSLVSDKRCCD